MPMPGKGCFVGWYDVSPGRGADHDHWHSHEHMIERVAIPGFLHGARYRALDGGQRTCVIYRTETLATLTSPAYLERLNAPTPWTQQGVGMIVDMNRTLASVVASEGAGDGGYLVTIKLAPSPGAADRLKAWLTGGTLAALAGRAGLNGAHLLIGDEDASNLQTEEKAIRGAPDQVADWILLIEGYDLSAVEHALAEMKSVGDGRGLIDNGAAPGADYGLYSLDFALGETEAKQIWRLPTN